MCGFIVYENGALFGDISQIVKRGPDSTSITQGKFWTAVQSRLSCENEVDGTLPYHINGGSLFYNGEIYADEQYGRLSDETEENFFEKLIRSESWPQKVVDSDGMFAIAFCTESSVTFFRDPLGIKPLFYSDPAENKFILGSSLPALLSSLGRDSNKVFDEDQIRDYFEMNKVCLEEKTFFSGIKTVEPGYIYRFDFETRALTITPYASFPEFLAENAENQSSKGKTSLVEANKIRLHLQALNETTVNRDREATLLLSGGLDSQIVLHCLCQTDIDLDAQTWVLPSYEADLNHAIAAADQNGVVLHVKEYGESLGEIIDLIKTTIDIIGMPPAGLNTCLSLGAFQDIKARGKKIVFSGDGADEVFLGYGKYFMGEVGSKSLAYQDQKEDRSWIYGELLTRRKENNDLIGSKIRRSLQQIDHLSASNGLEVRFPFLRRSLLKLHSEITSVTKSMSNNHVGKPLLREAFSDVAESGQTKRVKQNPQTEFLHTRYRDEISQLILTKSVEMKNICKIEDLQTSLDRSMAMDSSLLTWQFLCLAIMFGAEL
ncbi:MAG: asparagine synthase-related protein [Pseudomonadota bacterium]|nr:asparagine synthase-related protein [Pseudomonadota bacterium]